jgi:hypothetical protein
VDNSAKVVVKTREDGKNFGAHNKENLNLISLYR